jgi:hypothetical protein
MIENLYKKKHLRLLSSCAGVEGVVGLEAPLPTPPGGAELLAGTSGPPGHTKHTFLPPDTKLLPTRKALG